MSPLEVALSIIKTIGVFILSIYFMVESIIYSFIPRSFKRKDVSGQTALITGAGSGIGRIVARILATKGVKIISWDINEKGNAETARQIERDGGTCITYTVNLCNRQAIYQTAEKVKKDVGKVDILVNNAGVVTCKRLLDSSDESIQRTFDVNVLSHFWTIKSFLPDMMKNNEGHIVTIASLAGIFGLNQLVDYCSSKFAAVGLDEALRVELYIDGYTGIDTTVVCPNLINTGMFAGARGTFIPEMDQEYAGAEIVDAILMKSRQLIIPPSCSGFVATKGLLSVRTQLLLSKSTGAVSSMEGFVGRRKGV